MSSILSNPLFSLYSGLLVIVYFLFQTFIQLFFLVFISLMQFFYCHFEHFNHIQFKYLSKNSITQMTYGFIFVVCVILMLFFLHEPCDVLFYTAYQPGLPSLIKDHRLDGLTKNTLFLTVLEARSPRRRCQLTYFPTFFPRRLFPCCLLRWHRERGLWSLFLSSTEP